MGFEEAEGEAVREIIFRYWYKSKANKFSKEFTLNQILNGEPFDVLENEPLMSHFKMSGVVEQHTGRTDEAGSKIFEGDIFHVTDGDGWIIGEHIAKMDVETLELHQDCIGLIVGNIHNKEEK